MNSISVNDVMALRNAILDRNTALRNVASNPVSGAARGAVFEAAMNTALENVNSRNPVAGVSGAAGVSQTGHAEPGGFASTFQNQLQRINAINARAGALTVAYERGEETDIAQVMLARQESSIAFETTLQARNKVLSAYKDIMSMPV